jgi:peptidoglycan-associated lipoprotein
MMTPLHHRSLIALLLASTLAACSNVPPTESTSASTATPTTGSTAAQTQAVDADAVKARSLADAAAKAAATKAAADAAKAAAAVKPLESIGAPNQRSVYFDFDKYEVRDEFKSQVTDHAKFIVPRKDARLLIQGNADERGSREYNLALGQRRADAVKKTLMLQGVTEEQVESVSLGEEKPKATGHDEAAWAENRRADMLYKGEF